MVQFIKDSGPKTAAEKAKALKSGKMEASMSATGRMIWLTEEAGSFTQTVTFMKACGLTTKPKAEVSMSTLMEPIIRVTGGMIDSMDMVLRRGPTTLDSRAITNLERNTELAPSSGTMVLVIQANFTLTTFTEKVSTFGVAGASTKVNGNQTKCMARVSLSGQTVANT